MNILFITNVMLYIFVAECSCCIGADVLCFRRIHTLIGHKAEISSAQFNYDCSLIATGSMDKTCKIWETNHGV